MRIPKSECDHLRKEPFHIPRICLGGNWYKRWYCPTCGSHLQVYDRPVDQNNQWDCEAADASQGIV